MREFRLGISKLSSSIFFKRSPSQESMTEQLQYTMTNGHPKLLNSAVLFFERKMGLKVNVDKEILVSSGAQSVLCCLMQGILNQNDEVIVFDPAFDLYRPLIEFSGGKHIGVNIKPKTFNTKQMMMNRYQNNQFIQTNDDLWEIDFNHLRQIISNKTKLIIINSPMNPIGKCRISPYYIWTTQTIYLSQMYNSSKIERQNCLYYECWQDVLSNRIKSWICNRKRRYYQRNESSSNLSYILFKSNYSNCKAKCLDQTIDSLYFDQIRNLYEQQSQKLLKGLVESRLNFNYWVPSGGYFILTDIQNIEIPQKYFIQNGVKVTRDFAFAYYMINQFGVVCIPCSPYFENKEAGQNLVRWAFCKTDQTLQEAINRLK